MIKPPKKPTAVCIACPYGVDTLCGFGWDMVIFPIDKNGGAMSAISAVDSGAEFAQLFWREACFTPVDPPLRKPRSKPQWSLSLARAVPFH